MMKSEGEYGTVPHRRRGRPAGKNRVPLSMEQRRARNALYERERRNETADSLSQLAEVVGCDPNVSNADILATAIHQIQRASDNNSEDIANLKRINASLESQIAMIQSRLGIQDDELHLLEENDNQQSDTHSSPSHHDHQSSPLRNQLHRTKRKKSSQSSDYNTRRKRIKTHSETSSEFSSVFETCYEDSSSTNDERGQHWTQHPQLEDIEEVTAAQAQLHTELYNEIYNSESQCSTVSSSTTCLDSLAQSLLTVSNIRSPKKALSFSGLQQTRLETTVATDRHCDVTTSANCELPLDILSEREKRMIRKIIDSDIMDDHLQQNVMAGNNFSDDYSRLYPF